MFLADHSAFLTFYIITPMHAGSGSATGRGGPAHPKRTTYRKTHSAILWGQGGSALMQSEQKILL